MVGGGGFRASRGLAASPRNHPKPDFHQIPAPPLWYFLAVQDLGLGCLRSAPSYEVYAHVEGSGISWRFMVLTNHL